MCMMCVLAQTEHFHRISVVVESKMKRKAGGGQGEHLSGSYAEFNTSLSLQRNLAESGMTEDGLAITDMHCRQWEM